MNGVTLGGGDLSDKRVREFTAWFRGLTKVWLRLFDWGPAETRRLSDSAGFDSLAVPLPVWFDTFPSSVGASVDAFCRFVEYDLPEHPSLRPLIEARAGFTAAERDAR
jgi:hypothetical protein